MDQVIISLLSTGNVAAIFCGVVVYLIIYFQRKSTASSRDQEITELKTNQVLLKQRIESVETVTNNLSTKMDKIIDGINELNIQIAKLTTRQENK